jgi:hypothetical protein
VEVRSPAGAVWALDVIPPAVASPKLIANEISHVQCECRMEVSCHSG